VGTKAITVEKLVEVLRECSKFMTTCLHPKLEGEVNDAIRAITEEGIACDNCQATIIAPVRSEEIGYIDSICNACGENIFGGEKIHTT
jgi:hypothetical protein